MDKRTFFISIICAVCCISLIVNGALVYTIVKDTQLYQKDQVNKRVLDFRNMFTEYVLLSDKEIDFNTRLGLETSVRNLNDKEIFDQWEKFTKCQTKESATIEAKNLLQLLIKKTSS